MERGRACWSPGLLKAIGELWPGAGRQRGTVYRLRNVRAKLPRDKALREHVRHSYWSALDDAAGVEDAERRLRALVGELTREYPSAAACLADDLSALCVHLRYPLRLRPTNLLERSLEEVQRRVKAIGRFPAETRCPGLCRAVLDLVVAGAHGLGLTELHHHELERLREERVRSSTPFAETA